MHFNDISCWLVGEQEQARAAWCGPGGAAVRGGALRLTVSHTGSGFSQSWAEQRTEAAHSSTGTTHPATSQFLRVQPAAVTPLDNSITRPPHPGHAAPVADSSAVLAPVPVRPRLISRGHCWQDGAGVCSQEWGQQQPSPGSMSVNGSLSVYSPTPTKVNTATRH